jgi:glucokinase
MIGAVDIGGTKIAVGMVDGDGQVLARAECPTNPERGFDDALGRISTLLRETQTQAGGAMRGVGIGCTGPVYPLAGTIGDVEFLPGWEGVNIVEALTREFSLPVALENDADAATLGESAWGAGRGVGTFIYVTVSTGIGGGIALDGRLYRGVDGAHPEIGHHVIDPSGPVCFCGAHGCWESLASGRAMAQWFKDNAPGDLPDLSSIDSIDARGICSRSDSHAQAAIAREGYYLGLGLANLVTIFVPDVIALGGGLMQSRHLFWGAIQQTIQSTCGYVPYQKVRLVPASLGAEVGLIGAAQVWIHHFG